MDVTNIIEAEIEADRLIASPRAPINPSFELVSGPFDSQDAAAEAITGEDQMLYYSGNSWNVVRQKSA